MTNIEASAETRLAIYGTLAPGGINHEQIADLKGSWRKGVILGRFEKAQVGDHVGLPGLLLDPAGQMIDVQVFESADLPDHWARLDAFEGVEFQRVVTNVETADGPVAASIYVIVI